MTRERTRRDFLKIAGVGAAALATNSEAAAQVSGIQPAPPLPPIEVWVTDQQRRLQPAQPLQWGTAPSNTANRIVLEFEQQFQSILGFGAAFTDASCYLFSQLPDTARGQLFRELFHPSEMGLNVCRICVGSSDYSVAAYSFDEGDADPQLTRFSIDHDRQYILPMLREARKTNPDLFLFASPWSPPGWMKSGGSMLGGSMRRRYLPVYAKYFLKFLQAYAAEGVPVQAITPQNEVDTDQDGRMPACIWPQEYEIEFVRDHLGPLLEQASERAQIWILDHNYNLWGRATCELEDDGLRKYCNAVAWHGYAGTPEMMSKVHDAYPNVDMHWTEGGPDYTASDYETDWANWGRTFTGVLRNWCTSITGWNLALDEHGKPNIGPFSCGGMVTIHSQTKKIVRSGQYWAFAHFARAIRRGARRFESTGTIEGVDHVACTNADGRHVVILTNRGPAQTVSLAIGDAVGTTVPLPADSMTTLSWD